jgi:phosphatidylserine/phosphatidylglycerophosphate/cardiolipin synthase-like enzyme
VCAHDGIKEGPSSWKTEDGNVKLIIEPNDGVAPIVAAIKNAKKSVEIVVFRFDYGAIEAALKAAVVKGVKVTALIADTNRGGVKSLRELEMRFLAAGIVVARTADDLIRYHDKLIIIDRRTLYMLSFNFTRLDIGRSRGFGIVTKNTRLVQEAVKLFEADCTRCTYTPKLDVFVVSPENSRKMLGRFLKRAKKQLLIYDPKISDKEMIGILRDRAKAGVEIRIIGRITARLDLTVKKPTSMRLHTRSIIRDQHQAFVGSQSLRSAELDLRRELGLIVRDPKIIKKLADTFESDWAANGATKEREIKKEEAPETPEKDTEKATQVLAQELHPMSLKLKKAVKKAVADAGEEAFDQKMVKNTVKKMVKKAVKEAVKEVAQEAKELEKSV